MSIVAKLLMKYGAGFTGGVVPPLDYPLSIIFFWASQLERKAEGRFGANFDGKLSTYFFGQNRPKNFSLGFWLIFESLHAA